MSDPLDLTPELGDLAATNRPGTNVVGVGAVEVSPPFDHAEITALAAAHLAHEWLALYAVGRQGRG